MKLSALIDQTRKQLDDVSVKPQLWSDADIALYLNEALREACIRAKLIYDKQTDITLITILPCPVTPDTPTGFAYRYPLDSSIFLIDSAEYVDTKKPLRDISKDEFYQNRWNHRYGYGYGGDPNSPYGDYNAASAGRADKYWPDINTDESVTLRLVPLPNASTYVDVNNITQPIQIRLGVYRTQLCELTLSNKEKEPEIHRRHHLNLIDGACSRAFMRRDKDAHDPQKLSDCEARFTREFGQPIDANTIRQQREFRRHRTVCHFPR